MKFQLFPLESKFSVWVHDETGPIFSLFLLKMWLLGTYWVFCIGILMNIHSLYMFLVSFPGIILKHSFHKVLASVLCLVSFSLNYLIYFSCLHWHFFLFSIFTEFQILVKTFCLCSRKLRFNMPKAELFFSVPLKQKIFFCIPKLLPSQFILQFPTL